MRITNKMLTSRYTKDLNNSLSTLNYLAEKVETGRKFFRGSEDPVGAIKAYRLRREADQNDDYIANLKEIDSVFTSAESNLMGIQKNLNGIYTGYLEGMNGTQSPETRSIIANELKGIQDSMVTALNAKFNEKFLFSGNSMETPPFEIKQELRVGTTENKSVLYYKGVKVTDVKTGSAEYKQLEELSKEVMQLDIGLSLNVSADGKVNPNSVMDAAIPGIRALGFGNSTVDGVEVPNNLFDLCTEIAYELEKDSEIDFDRFTPLIKQFSDQRDTVLKEITDIGTKTQYIDFLTTRAEDNNLNIIEKMQDVEYEDPYKAIMDWRMQDYTYNAALQMGNKIIQPSFIDFMN